MGPLPNRDRKGAGGPRHERVFHPRVRLAWTDLFRAATVRERAATKYCPGRPEAGCGPEVRPAIGFSIQGSLVFHAAGQHGPTSLEPRQSTARSIGKRAGQRPAADQRSAPLAGFPSKGHWHSLTISMNQSLQNRDRKDCGPLPYGRGSEQPFLQGIPVPGRQKVQPAPLRSRL